MIPSVKHLLILPVLFFLAACSDSNSDLEKAATSTKINLIQDENILSELNGLLSKKIKEEITKFEFYRENYDSSSVRNQYIKNENKLVNITLGEAFIENNITYAHGNIRVTSRIFESAMGRKMRYSTATFTRKFKASFKTIQGKVMLREIYASAHSNIEYTENNRFFRLFPSCYNMTWINKCEHVLNTNL